MLRPITSVLLSAALTATASAQIVQYVAPSGLSTNGVTATGFAGALGAGTQHYRDMEVINPSGTPTELVFNNGPLTTTVRHRDGAGGALTGTYRDLQMTTFSIGGSSNRAVHTGNFGTNTTPDMFEISFSQPVGHWGATGYDVESLGSDPAYIRAYDSSMTLIYEAALRYPNNEDGDLTVNFLGITSTTANISKVTLQIGNSAAVAATNPDGENLQRIALLDMYYGSATADPNQLTTTFANNNAGNAGGALYFDIACTAPSGVTIQALDLNLGASAGLSGSIDLYARIGNLDWAGPIATGTVAATAGPGLPTHVTLASGLQLGPGCAYELAIVTDGFRHNYTTGTAPLPLTYSNADLTLDLGEASNFPFLPPFFSPRVANLRLYYAAGGTCPEIAGVETLGEGCETMWSSIYERLPPASFDLAGSGMTFAVDPSDDRISVLHDPAAVLQPFSTALDLGLDDDDQVAVSSFAGTNLPLVVGSNGWVAEASGNSNAYMPSIGTMLDNPERAFYSWKDFHPNAAGSGHVYYEEQTIGPFERGIVTFDGVYGWGQTTPNTLQFVCDFISLAGGGYELLQVQIVWGAMAGDGTDILVGYSPGGPSNDPGPTDLSTILSPTQTAPSDLRFVLQPVGRPVQSGAATPFDLQASNIPAGSFGHIGIIGLVNPSFPLDGFGIPGCTLYATLNVLSPLQLVTGSTVTWSPLTLPALPANFSGFEFYTQSCILGTPLNGAFGFGAIVSNGLKCTVGTL